jgi:rsbT co-antagonist protein RsbR
VITADTTTETLHTEIAALRQRVADLERARDEAERRTQLYETIVQRIPTGVAVWRLEQPDDPFSIRLVGANAAGNRQSNGIELNALVGQRMIDIFPTVPEILYQIYAEVVRSGQPRDMGETTFADEQGNELLFSIQLFPLPDDCLCVAFENITERKRTEGMLRQSIALEETIRAQQATLAELSTPLIPISDQVVAMPLIGSVDSRRAQQVLDTLLQGIAASGAQVAILDITGVPVVDTQVADALLRAAQAVKLLGAQVVLTGIRPEVAQTLVGLGANLSGIVTRSSLQSGIAYATSRN